MENELGAFMGRFDEVVAIYSEGFDDERGLDDAVNEIRVKYNTFVDGESNDRKTLNLSRDGLAAQSKLYGLINDMMPKIKKSQTDIKTFKGDVSARYNMKYAVYQMWKKISDALDVYEEHKSDVRNRETLAAFKSKSG
jgi:hypothetical protein